jgi:nitrite reductase/ring-hydroxylating ferredoxin subunit
LPETKHIFDRILLIRTAFRAGRPGRAKPGKISLEMKESGSLCQKRIESTPLQGGVHMHRIAAEKDLEPGNMKELLHQGKKILLLRTEEGFFALGSRCTHLGCRLAEGTLQGTTLTCPCHFSQFDVRTGAVLEWIPRWPDLIGKATKFIGLSRPLPRYPLEVAEGFVYLQE